MYSFVAAYLDRAVGQQQHHIMTHVHTDFSELQHLLDHKRMEEALVPQSVNTIQHSIRNSKVLLKDTFDAYFETGLYTLKFYMLSYII